MPTQRPLTRALGELRHRMAYPRVAWLFLIFLAIFAITALSLYAGQWILRFAIHGIGAGAIVASNVTGLLVDPWFILVGGSLLLLGSAIAIFQVAFWVAAVHHADDAHTLRELIACAYEGALGVVERSRAAKLLTILYVFLVLPLGGLAMVRSVGVDIAVPEFVISELLKFNGGVIVYGAFLLAITWVNLRLILTVPYLVTSDVSFRGALTRSWKRMKVCSLILLLPMLFLPALLSLLGSGLVNVLAWSVAGIEGSSSAGALGLAGLLLGVVQIAALAVTFAVALLVAYLGIRAVWSGGAPVHEPSTVHEPDSASSLAAEGLASGRARRPAPWMLVGGAVVVVVGLGAVNAQAVNNTAVNDVAVLAHRGVPHSEVENSIAGLEHSAQVGADYVELDLLESSDQKLVVFHDTTLRRLAGSSARVADLTAADLTATKIRQNGKTATIPSFEEFLARAQELDQKLLIEVKTHGSEAPGFAGRFVAALDKYGANNDHLIQSSSLTLLNEIRDLDPALKLGYVVPFAFGVMSVPEFDFYAVEQAVLSPRIMNLIPEDSRMFVWTVNDARTLRNLATTPGVDGVITSEAQMAVTTLENLRQREGISMKFETRMRALLGL